MLVIYHRPYDSIALWDKGLFGLNYPYQSDGMSTRFPEMNQAKSGTDPKNNNYNNDEPVHPLREDAHHPLSQWFGHGLIGFPPKAGDFMLLPSGGTYNGEQYQQGRDIRCGLKIAGEVACNRAQTTLRDPNLKDPLFKYACTVSSPGLFKPYESANVVRRETQASAHCM